jgi:hypothetical protein
MPEPLRHSGDGFAGLLAFFRIVTIPTRAVIEPIGSEQSVVAVLSIDTIISAVTS